MNEPCYYIPKQLFTPEYSNYSTESKLLFGIVLSEAKQTKSIEELYNLIEKNKNELNKMHEEIENIEKRNERSV